MSPFMHFMGKVNYKVSAPPLIDNGENINGDGIQDDVPETMICLVSHDDLRGRYCR